MQVIWSCSGKTICLWSADTGAWLGKIGGSHGVQFYDKPCALQVMWSCSGKTICLWSADTGAWLGKIGGDRELEEALAPSQASFFEGAHSGIAHARDEFSSFTSEHGGHQQINSAKVLFAMRNFQALRLPRLLCRPRQDESSSFTSEHGGHQR